MAEQNPTHVWVQHEETGGTWQCPADYLPVAELRGWQIIDAPDTDLDGLFDEPVDGVEQTGFDPSEHSVKEVNEHLAEHAEQAPGEVERVLELERAGKDRATVTDPRTIPSDTNPGD